MPGSDGSTIQMSRRPVRLFESDNGVTRRSEDWARGLDPLLRRWCGICFNRTRDRMAEAQGQDEVWHLFHREQTTEPDTEADHRDAPEPVSEASKRFEAPVPAHS